MKQRGEGHAKVKRSFTNEKPIMNFPTLFPTPSLSLSNAHPLSISQSFFNGDQHRRMERRHRGSIQSHIFRLQNQDHRHCRTLYLTGWISDIELIHRRRLGHLIISLDIEWRPNFGRYNNPADILQLCVGRICLIYQLIYTDFFPQKLRNFLTDEDYNFVGVGIGADVGKLEEDWDLEVSNAVDLRHLAAKRMGMRRDAELKELATEVLGVEVEKPRNVTLSRWDRQELSYDQIQYACVDAFMSFGIGRG
ncbi:hypothetical protein Ancab_009944 [Ancistrocladus abbreviatus]